MSVNNANKKTELKGVLFDMDDTLINWDDFDGDWFEMERKHLQNLLSFLEDVNRVPNTDIDHLHETFRELWLESWETARETLVSPHIGKVLLATLAKYNIPEDDVITQRSVAEAYGISPTPGVVTFPDVYEFLPILLQQGIKIGIVTNAGHPFWMRQVEIEHYNLAEFFADSPCMISAADVGYIKPSPKIFNHALDLMELTADECIYVGDNTVADIAGAQGVGMKAILRVKSNPLLISGMIVPDYAVNSLMELTEVFKDWYQGW